MKNAGPSAYSVHVLHTNDSSCYKQAMMLKTALTLFQLAIHMTGQVIANDERDPNVGDRAFREICANAFPVFPPRPPSPAKWQTQTIRWKGQHLTLKLEIIRSAHIRALARMESEVNLKPKFTNQLEQLNNGSLQYQILFGTTVVGYIISRSHLVSQEEPFHFRTVISAATFSWEEISHVNGSRLSESDRELLEHLTLKAAIIALSTNDKVSQLVKDDFRFEVSKRNGRTLKLFQSVGFRKLPKKAASPSGDFSNPKATITLSLES